MKQKIIITFVAIFVSFRIMADNTILVGTIDVNATVSESGGAVVTIPIDVPAGINGMQPSLALVYNSQGGLGTCGWGWSLSGLSSISRTGSSVYHDNQTKGILFTTDDHLMLDGQRLMSASGSYWGTNSTYRTEIETFNLVTYKSSSLGFTVWAKDGKKAFYGNSTQSRLQGVNGGILSWNISKVIDPNGNYITYHYTNGQNLAERNLSEIRYAGNDSTNTPSAYKYKVTFEYQDLTAPRYYYENGIRFDQTKRLDKIRIYSGNQELYHYELTYNTTVNVHPQLASVRKFAVNGDSFNPIQFTWNSASSGSVVLKTVTARKDSLLFGDFNGDGKMDIFSYKEDNRAYTLYINTSTASTVNFSSSQGQTNINIHGAQASDYDGDGKNDIVFSCKNGSNYYLYYLTYSNGLSTPTYIGSTSTETFLVGDFDGDGKEEIVCPGVRKMYKYEYWQNVAMDFTLPTAWSDISGFSYSLSGNNVPLDFNGNGKTDILDFNDIELKVLELENNGNAIQFSVIEQLSLSNVGLTTALCQNLKFGDFNGDGKTDILFTAFNESEARVLLSKGTGFDTSRVQNINYPIDHTFDYNNDGLTDIGYCISNNNVRRLYIGVNNGANFNFVYQTLNSVTADDIDREKVFFYDLLGDGRSEFISFKSTTTIKTKRLFTSHPLLLTRVTDSMGQNYNFTYKPVSDGSVYTNSSSTAFPILPLRSSLYVVSGFTAPYTSLQYAYSNGRIHLQGKGFLGFLNTTVTDNLNSRKNQTTKVLNNDYYLLEPKKVEVLTSSGDSVSRTDYVMNYRTYDGRDYVFPYVHYIYSKDYLTTLREIQQDFYDPSGNLTIRSLKRGALEEVVFAYYTQSSSWCPEKMYRENAVYYFGGDSDSRETFWRYDAKGNVIRMVEDSAYTLKRVHTYDYDMFGHVTSETVSGSGQTRHSSTTWSNDGRFPVSTTDALGMTTSYNYDTTTGLLTSMTSPEGTTTYTYDPFGRLRTSSTPDGTVHSTSLAFVSGYSEIKYCITDSVSAAPPVTTWYGPTGKPLYKKTLGFGSQPIFTAYGYNSNGAAAYVSEPFSASSLSVARTRTFTAANATMYGYDEYGRVYTVYSPKDSIRYIYSGLSTWTESRESMTLTTRDNTGMVIQKTLADGMFPLSNEPMWQPRDLIDQSRSIRYSYYPTGQMKTIVPDGGDTISLEYDIRGNRTKLIDPDAGTITDTYNAFDQPTGHTQKIHGNSNVSTTYTYDSNGRLLSEQIIGNENRTKSYSYDTTFKNLVKKVFYDNNNQTSYSYDNLGRLTNTAQTVGGMTLTESYGYGNYSQPSNHNHDGTVNETYDYDSNGYLTKERLGTSDVWQLLSVNDQGQVLQEKKSGITTTYTYDDAGRILTIYAPGIVNLEYSYDRKGNMKSKLDYISDQLITYNYDNKNRLVGWNVIPNPVIPALRSASSVSTTATSYTMTYDDITGNILTKSDLGANAVFDYNETPKPHALDGISGVTGNLMSDPVSVTYTDFGKVSTITKGSSAAYAISYAAQGGRGKSVLTKNGHNTDRYYSDGSERVYDWGAGVMRRLAYFPHGAIIVNEEAIPADKASSPEGDNVEEEASGLSSPPSPPSGTILQGYYDAQGSLIALVTTGGTVVRRYAYDPWGRRVSPSDWTQADTQADTYHINRGYTMHEHLDDFGLINMNGRVFDPLTAQFLSPDNYIQSDGNWLNYNRYAYCLNNPLKYSDPSGDIAIEAIVFSAYICGVVNLMSNHDAIMNSNNVATAALGYFTVGALAGAASTIVGGAVTGGMLYSGFLGGAASGAASSAASGFIMGAGNAWMGGAGFSNGLLAGLQSGGIGALTGGIMGGLSEGIMSAYDGYSFWDGHGEEMRLTASQIKGDYNPDMKDMDGYLKERVSSEFGVKEGDYGIKRITTKHGNKYTLSEGMFIYSKTGEEVAGYCVPFHRGGTAVHISPRVATNTSYAVFESFTGHELIHAYHHYLFDSVGKYNKVYSERSAHIYTYDNFLKYTNTSRAKVEALKSIALKKGFWGYFPPEYHYSVIPFLSL